MSPPVCCLAVGATAACSWSHVGESRLTYIMACAMPHGRPANCASCRSYRSAPSGDHGLWKCTINVLLSTTPSVVRILPHFFFSRAYVSAFVSGLLSLPPPRSQRTNCPTFLPAQ